jgi:hypothetical protein
MLIWVFSMIIHFIVFRNHPIHHISHIQTVSLQPYEDCTTKA